MNAASSMLLTVVVECIFKTWCNRFSVSVKVTISHLGFLHFGSVLFSLRFPNGGFEMHSRTKKAAIPAAAKTTWTLCIGYAPSRASARSRHTVHSRTTQKIKVVTKTKL